MTSSILLELIFSVPVIMLVMFFTNRYKIPEKKMKKVENKTEVDNSSRAPAIQLSPTARKWLIALFAITLNAYNAIETNFFVYGSTYCQYLPIRISAPTAARLMSMMSTTYTVGRCLSAFIAAKLAPNVMLCYHMVIISCSVTVLYFGQNSLTMVYIGMGAIGG